ncbi:MAG: hypothetical protein KBC64_05390 [Simkaniaceae bacterium]|nr:hypothetical protein [Simkaniaceae bacterium]
MRKKLSLNSHNSKVEGVLKSDFYSTHSDLIAFFVFQAKSCHFIGYRLE